MTLYQPEPVEISTRMRPGEWTEASLEELVTTYRAKILAMGATAYEVVSEVERNDDGSVKVSVSWAKPAVADEDAEKNAGKESMAGGVPDSTGTGGTAV